MRLPFLDQAVVPDAKLVRYLLDPVHPRGRSKAAFFERLGFTADRPDELRLALLDAASRAEMEEIASSYGLKYTGVGRLRTPGGSEVAVRTVWMLRDALPPPIFVTAYPAQDMEDE